MAGRPIDIEPSGPLHRRRQGLNTEILRLFNGQLSSMVDQLLTVLQQRDARRWREVTHTIKGAARGVGAFAVGEAAAAAEPIDPTLSQDRAIQASIEGAAGIEEG